MKSLANLITTLSREAARNRSRRKARAAAIANALPLLEEALALLNDRSAGHLVTYKIVTDQDGKLKRAARIACNFWNGYLTPKESIVIRLGTFKRRGDTVAEASEPFRKDGVVYGAVDYNSRHLEEETVERVAGTIVHEIGHTLGIGSAEWRRLFNRNTGAATKPSVRRLPALANTWVELEGGEGTAYVHWSEDRFGSELMTGWGNRSEHVLPVTIDVMELFGHQLTKRLPKRTRLNALLEDAERFVFQRRADAKVLDLDHFKKTKMRERLPSRRSRRR